MAISEDAAVIESQQWPQGDKRDPLGVWGVRHGVTGDASGGSIKVLYQVTSPKRAAFVYTCYAITFAQLTGAITADNIKCRLLTGWPNVDTQAGVQAFGTVRFNVLAGGSVFTAPLGGPSLSLVTPEQRFILLYDPRPSGEDLTIVEVEWPTNVNLATYSFEGYGYYWDRSVLQAPGGPRHPGSS